MAEIFLSYVAEDRGRAQLLAETLERKGWSVWWDQELLPGDSWADFIERELVEAGCVVVLWSSTSVESDWVKKEARYADKHGILVPARIEDVEPPFEFEHVQAANLVGWSGSETAKGFKRLVSAIAARVPGPTLGTREAGKPAAQETREPEARAAEARPKPPPDSNRKRALRLGALAAVLIVGGVFVTSLLDGEPETGAPEDGGAPAGQDPPPPAGPVETRSLTAGSPSTYSGQASGVMGLAYNNLGYRLATGGMDGGVEVWDATTGARLRTLTGHTDQVRGLAFNPDRDRLATGGWDNSASVWDLLTDERMTLTGHSDAVTSVTLVMRGRRLATASLDRTVKVWDVGTGDEVLTLEGHTDGVYGVAYTGHGNRLATASWDFTVKVWDAATGTELLTLTGQDEFHAVAFSPDGTRLAAASAGSAKVWDATTGDELLTLAHPRGVTSVAFSDLGDQLATGSWDGTAKVWDARTGNELLSLRAHGEAVTNVAFTPLGRRLATASLDGTVKEWPLHEN